MEEYLTIGEYGEDVFIEKKSRFIGYAKPVKTHQEALDFINEIKSKHWDATHNVYAYSLREGQIKRYSDDGEPQGTAGIPTLEILNKSGLVDCCVVVTRYFGGILLGAGGLVRAYGHAAKIAVEKAGKVRMCLCKEGKLACDYNFYGRAPAMLTDAGAVINDTVFADRVEILFHIPENKLAPLREKVIDASLGKFDVEVTGEKFARCPIEDETQ